MPKTSEQRPLLLDTHVWLWLVLGTGGLSTEVRDAISDAASIGNLRIAAITAWEVALLAARNRIALGQPTLKWIEEAIARSGIAIEPLSPAIAAESWDLPIGFHQDPVDRILVATARIAGVALLTRDRRILDYAGRGHLTAIAA